MKTEIASLLKNKTYRFEITSPDGTKVIHKKYLGKWEGEAYDKLNKWLTNHDQYNEWKVKFKGVSYLNI